MQKKKIFACMVTEPEWCPFQKSLQQYQYLVVVGGTRRKGNRFFLSEPNGMELSNQVLVSMFKWWDEIN